MPIGPGSLKLESSKPISRFCLWRTGSVAGPCAGLKAALNTMEADNPDLVRSRALVRLKYDHPSGGRLFTVVGRVERGFYRLSSNYLVDSVSKFKVSHVVIAHETEFEIVDV